MSFEVAAKALSADVVNVATRGEGLAVTLTVTNKGTKTGSTTCVLNDPAARFGDGIAECIRHHIAIGRARHQAGETRMALARGVADDAANFGLGLEA